MLNTAARVNAELYDRQSLLDELRVSFERGFVAGENDVEALTKLLGHAPRCYENFARETTQTWQEQTKSAKV